MAGFCVILCGRLPGNSDDASVWAPLKAAFNLDDASFEQRVLSAVPLIVRQNLDEPAAADLVQKMVASGVDAVVMQDDAQLAYFEREGTRRGPVPRSALGHFIHTNERYRLRGEQDWSVWGEAAIVAVPPLMPLAGENDPAVASAPVVPTTATPPVAPSPPVDPGASSEPAVVPVVPVIPVVPVTTAVVEAPAPPAAAPTANTEEDDEEDFDDEHAGEEVDEFESELPEHPGEAANLSPMPGNGETMALEYDNVEPPPRSNAGIWIVLFIIVALAAGAFAWSSMKHGAAPIATPVQPASPTPLTAPAVESSAAPASTAQLPPAAPTTAGDPANAATVAQASAGSPAAASTSAGVVAAAGSTARSSLPRHCEASATNPQAPEEVTLLSDGKNHLTGRNVRAGTHGELFIVEAALGYDGECRPNPFQVYVFSRGKLAGTLSPQPMQARTDGAISSFRLIDPEHLQIEVARYKPGDSPCCASSQEERTVDLEQYLQDPPAAAPTKTTSASTESGIGHVGTALTAASPSLDCAKANSPTDSTICGDSALGGLDIKVASIYRQAAEKATADNKLSLKDDQQQWLQYRSRCNADKDCIERQSKARIALLQTQFNVK